MSERIYNFSAGPAVLPLPVLEQAQAELLSLPGVGMSVLEISHRSKTFTQIIESAEARLRALLKLPSNYHLLFVQGGASLQFSMLAMNFLKGGRAGYIDSGSWAGKAFKEAQKLGLPFQAWSGKSENYTRMPSASEIQLDGAVNYLHLTSNETIQGIALPSDLELGVPVICDASSDILSRPLEIERYDMIYAGAQKNMGPAGVTLVILSDELLASRAENLPTMLDYQTFVQHKSLYNTPPVFSIYMLDLVAKWVQEQGGLEAMHQRNRDKSKLLYQTLDQSNGFYRGHAQPDSRSLMNVTFRLPSAELEQTFLSAAETEGFSGLKGHRSVGGIRASIYNAFPPAGVQALVDFMQEFQRTHG